MRGIGLVLDQELKAIRPFSGFPVRGFAGSPYTVANLELFLYSVTKYDPKQYWKNQVSTDPNKALNPLTSPCSGMWSIMLQGPDDFQWGVGQISIMLRIILLFFSIKNAKSWKPRKSRLEIPTKPGNPSTRAITFRIVMNLPIWVENEVEREINKGSECSRKLKYSGLGWRRSPRALKKCFLNSTMIICLHFSRSTAKLDRFTTFRKVIALVEGFPGFVEIYNRDFRGFQEFAFLIQKKLKMIRSIIEICPTPHRKC